MSNIIFLYNVGPILHLNASPSFMQFSLKINKKLSVAN